MNKIKKRINQGINFLRRVQKTDGSFDGITATDRALRISPVTRHTTFVTSLITESLSVVEKENSAAEATEIAKISQKAVDFLLAEKSDHWTWNYWQRGSEEFCALPYPDDIDDTCCALLAIQSQSDDNQHIDTAALATIVQNLTTLEDKPGGPYHTWFHDFRDDARWHDIDVAVNSNIAYFLGRYDVTVAGIKDLIEDAIRNHLYTSKYYCSPHAIIYFISRTYIGKSHTSLQKELLAHITEQFILSEKYDHPLEASLILSAYLNLGGELEKGVDSTFLQKTVSYILADQSSETHSWSAYAFYREAIQGEQIFYTGSDTLTTAFCIEALQKYSDALALTVLPVSDAETYVLSDEALEIDQAIQKQFLDSLPLLQNQGLEFIQNILTNDVGKQITLLPYFFNPHFPRETTISLGIANLAGWIAYTIYDDFLDNEGYPELLSLANVCLREVCHIYQNILPATAYPVFRSVMDTIDRANSWERKNCYIGIANGMMSMDFLPDFGEYHILAEKSLGHALGPLAMMVETFTEKDMRDFISFFTHYLIARQLNDDAHDWLEDLKRGFVNSSSVHTLRLWRAGQTENDYPMIPNLISIESAEDELRTLFWNKTIVHIADEIQKHVDIARLQLSNNPLIENPDYFETLLTPIEQAAKKALLNRTEVHAFLESYTASPY